MKKNKVKQSTLGLAVVAALILVFSCTSVFAFLTGMDSKDNEWQVGYVETIIEEDFNPPKELEPGISFVKDVKASNIGPSEAYVRMKVVFSDGDMEKASTLDYNTTDFILKNDGYWYYPQVLQSNESTPSLFTTVSLSDEIKKEDLKDFDIQIYLESYQAREYENYEDAWNHYKENKK